MANLNSPGLHCVPAGPRAAFAGKVTFSGEMSTSQKTVRGTKPAKQKLSPNTSLRSKEIQAGVSGQRPGNNLRARVEGITALGPWAARTLAL